MLYHPDFLADLDRTITRPRLLRYLKASGGDLEQALGLYEKNAALTEAVFGLLHGIEVPIRNSLHYAIVAAVGQDDWYRDGFPLPFNITKHLRLSAPMQDMVQKARKRAGPNAAIGKVIAEIPFGFWPFLVASSYQNLWTECLYKAFPHGRPRRAVVHTRLEAIQRLRNRVAHHEPILSSANEVYTGHSVQPTIGLPEILQCVEWVSPATADWVRKATRYDAAVAILNEVAGSCVTL